MIELKKIRTTDSEYSFTESLYVSAFPEEERRPVGRQRVMVDTSIFMNCFLISNDGVSIGFVTVWNFSRFVYIEHFAISHEFRNQGYGSLVLDYLQGLENKPIVLEAELPTDVLSAGRIKFYERNGFCVMNCDYTQPPYSEGQEWLPLVLLQKSTPSKQVSADVVVAVLYRNVYMVQ